MTRLVAGLGTLVFMLVSCSPALAVDYPKKTFDANYEVTGPTASSTMRMSSDGKGKMRIENVTATSKVVTISDYPNLAAITKWTRRRWR